VFYDVDLHLAFSLLARLCAFICGFSRSIIGHSIEKRLPRRGFPSAARSSESMDEGNVPPVTCRSEIDAVETRGELLSTSSGKEEIGAIALLFAADLGLNILIVTESEQRVREKTRSSGGGRSNTRKYWMILRKYAYRDARSHKERERERERERKREIARE